MHDRQCVYICIYIYYDMHDRHTASTCSVDECERSSLWSTCRLIHVCIYSCVYIHACIYMYITAAPQPSHRHWPSYVCSRMEAYHVRVARLAVHWTPQVAPSRTDQELQTTQIMRIAVGSSHLWVQRRSQSRSSSWVWNKATTMWTCMSALMLTATVKTWFPSWLARIQARRALLLRQVSCSSTSARTLMWSAGGSLQRGPLLHRLPLLLPLLSLVQVWMCVSLSISEIETSAVCMWCTTKRIHVIQV